MYNPEKKLLSRPNNLIYKNLFICVCVYKYAYVCYTRTHGYMHAMIHVWRLGESLFSFYHVCVWD